MSSEVKGGVELTFGSRDFPKTGTLVLVTSSSQQSSHTRVNNVFCSSCCCRQCIVCCLDLLFLPTTVLLHPFDEGRTQVATCQFLVEAGLWRAQRA
jgi:hypothetical protein